MKSSLIPSALYALYLLLNFHKMYVQIARHCQEFMHFTVNAHL